MGKLKLQVDALSVESFNTSRSAVERGTVGANATFLGTGGCYTCDFTRCVETCADTCDNSLDYCTCACTAACTEVGPGCHHISQMGSCPCFTEP
jgi:hypothetical protein